MPAPGVEPELEVVPEPPRADNVMPFPAPPKPAPEIEPVVADVEPEPIEAAAEPADEEPINEPVAPEPAEEEVVLTSEQELPPTDEPEPDAVAEADPEVAVEPEPVPEPELESEPEPEPEPEPDPEVVIEAEAEQELEPEAPEDSDPLPEPEEAADTVAEAAGGGDKTSNVVPLHKKDDKNADDEAPVKKGGSDVDDHYMRVTEALLFAAKDPLDLENVQARLPEDVSAEEVLDALQLHYRDRGVVLVKTGNRWSFRTAPDLSGVLEIETEVTRKLSRAAVETLAIIAYHQPVTRAEMEEVRGVAMSRGTLDVLLEAGWIRPGKRRKTPGRPVTWVTTPNFLDHFGLGGLDELPGVDDLKAAGLLDTRPALGVYRERMEGEDDPDDVDQEEMFDETDLPSNLMEAEET